MSGNCATGMRVSAIAPAMVMTTAMTMARRGRVMNTPEIMRRSPAAGARRRRGRAAGRRRTAGGGARRAGGRRLDAGGAGRDRLARTHALDALDDDAFAFTQSVGHCRQRRRGLAELNAALLRLVVAVDDI